MGELLWRPDPERARKTNMHGFMERINAKHGQSFSEYGPLWQWSVDHIHEFWAERNSEKYRNTNDEEDIETFSFLIAAGLLHEDVRNIYAAGNIHTGTDALKAWSSVGNLLFGDKPVDMAGNIKSVLFGLAVGDALGVPAEFQTRGTFPKVTEMVGGGVFRLDPGEWTDDTSMA